MYLLICLYIYIYAQVIHIHTRTHQMPLSRRVLSDLIGPGCLRRRAGRVAQDAPQVDTRIPKSRIWGFG